MSKLIVHPRDASTAFLKASYEDRDQATVVRAGTPRHYIQRMIEDHSVTMMMGHGSPYGLWGVSQFDRMFAIDGFFVPELARREHVYIWCNADMFVRPRRLAGFHTGMFISEVGEAWMCRVNADKDEVEWSNRLFADSVAQGETPFEMWEACMDIYAPLAGVSEVVDYNQQRLWYTPAAAA